MPDLITNKGKAELSSNGGVSWSADTIKAAVLKSPAAPTVDSNFLDEFTANEVTGAGYARQTLASKTKVEDDSLDQVTFDAADLAFGSVASGETATWIILFKDSGAAATSPVLVAYDIADTAFNGQPFNFAFAAGGCFKLA